MGTSHLQENIFVALEYILLHKRNDVYHEREKKRILVNV